MSAVTEQELAGLEAFTGDLLRPGEAGYEEARRALQRSDRQAAGADRSLSGRGRHRRRDRVRAAQPVSRSRSAVAATASPASALTDGGLMIDLSLMRGIYVDPVGPDRPRPAGRQLVGS